MIVNSSPKARLFVDAPLAEGEIVSFSEGQAHYLGHVLRAELGTMLALFNGRDGEWRARLGEIGKKRASARLEQRIRPQIASSDHWLMFAPIKGDRVDGVAEKATELGVSALLPVRTRRTVVGRINETRLLARAIEAAEQCERLDVPVVHPLRPLEDWLDGWPEERALILCDETGRGLPPDRLLPALKGRKAAILVGPEGGFAPEELERLHALPYVSGMTLGPCVLRADTAAIVAFACLQLFHGDWEEKPAFGALP